MRRFMYISTPLTVGGQKKGMDFTEGKGEKG